MDPVHQIRRLGWEWADDGLGLGLGPGVVLSVVVDGRTLRAFVPLSRVWLTFDRELQAVGCVGCVAVGAPFSSVGFLGAIKKAVKSVGKAASKVVPQAIKRAASTVVSTAKSAARSAAALPVVGPAVRAYGSLVTAPARAAQQLVSGQRIDRIAVSQLKSALANARTLAPYAQTVVSLVPGVGQGLSAGIGAAAALAAGRTIDQALIEGVRSSLPGGPLAQAAFGVAADVVQGKPLTAAAVNALPIDPAARSALIQGVTAARDLAAGKGVSQVVLDRALQNLPPEVQRAVQVGVALGQAKNLQSGAAAAVQGAVQLAATHSQGVAAAQQYARGVRNAPIIEAMKRAQVAQKALGTVVRQAQKGHPQANNVINALWMLRRVA